MPDTSTDAHDAEPPSADVAPTALRPRSRIGLDTIGLVVGPAAMLGWIWLLDAGSLTTEAHRLAGIMLLTIIWWVTEPIPIPATALLAVALTVFMGAIPHAAAGRFEPAKIALAPFASPSVYFLLGGLFIGRAMMRHGLDRRLALSILCTRWAGRSHGSLLLALGVSVCIISMWISNTAATAMLYPVTMGMIAVLAAGSGTSSHTFPGSRYASAMLLLTAYASSIGGISTPIGTATNVAAMGFFEQEQYLGRSIQFVPWTQVGIPLMAIIFGGLYLWLRIGSKPRHLDMPGLRQYLLQQRSQLGPWKRGEWNTLFVFVLVVGLWVAPGVLALAAPKHVQDNFSERFPEEIVALLVPVVLYLLPVNWTRREFTLDRSDLAHVDWGTLLLFGAGFSLGNLMVATGLAKVVGNAMFQSLGTDDVWAITALAVAAGILLSEITSNAASVTTLIPVIWSLCDQAGLVGADRLPPLFGVTFASSFGSALPVSTLPNAMVYSSGLIPMRRMIWAGVGLDVISGLAIWGVLRAAFALGWNP